MYQYWLIAESQQKQKFWDENFVYNIGFSYLWSFVPSYEPIIQKLGKNVPRLGYHV